MLFRLAKTNTPHTYHFSTDNIIKIVKSRLDSLFSMFGHPGNGYEAVIPSASNDRASEPGSPLIFLVLLSGSFSIDQMQLI